MEKLILALLGEDIKVTMIYDTLAGSKTTLRMIIYDHYVFAGIGESLQEVKAKCQASCKEWFLRNLIESSSFSTPEKNYVHTHTRVHYCENTRSLNAEKVCINEYGACYGLESYSKIQLTDNQVQLLDDRLLESPNWCDIEA